jgi:hypothetical protein
MTDTSKMTEGELAAWRRQNLITNYPGTVKK